MLLSRHSPAFLSMIFLTAVSVLGGTSAFAEVEPSNLERWQSDGAVVRDPEKKRSTSEGAFRLEPGSKMVLPLREAAGSGRVSMWVFDDGTAPNEEAAKARHIGPRWGVIQPDGRALAGAVLYAPYLSGEESYTISDSDQKIWHNVMGSAKRSPGWHEWVFDFDPEAGIKVTVDGRVPVRFDWNKLQVAGFSGLVLYGDSSDSKHPQTLWVDDISVSLGPPMKVAPTPPAPPPPVVPEKDPEVVGSVPEMLEAVRGNHPRLLFTAEDLPRLKKFYASDEGALWRKRLESYLPSAKPPIGDKFLTDATDGQRQGFWRLPTVALHYALTGDKTSFDRTVQMMKELEAMPNWETGSEVDSGMSAANIMIGAALAYDWLYNDLDPEFRETFRQKLLLHARKMYHGGHLKKNPGVHYWQNDPQNNHRWHRNAGLTLSVLAAYQGKPEEQWILQKTSEELAFINQWLPEDGTTHEGPSYMVFGANYLMLAMDAWDRSMGTEHLSAPFYKTLNDFMTGTMKSGFASALGYGDWEDSGLGGYNNFRFKMAARHNQADHKDAAMRMVENDPATVEFGWSSLLWDNPEVPRGDATKLPLSNFWPDVGVAVMRDTWEADGVSTMFKSGPFGGYLLNRFSKEVGDGYVNVAHNDPDANTFTIAMGDEFVAETDRYSKSKKSANHNTILINGFGQMTQGRPEGLVWSQPGGDMTKMGVITAWRPTPEITVVEGEAAGSYLAYTDKKSGVSRPALERFRRTYIWVNGGYILVLDDIRSPSPVDITWLVQGPDLRAVDESSARFELASKSKTCPFQITASVPMKFEIALSTADTRGKNLGLRQLAARANASQLRVASIFDPWGKKDLTVRMDESDPNAVKISVVSGAFGDTWTWKPGSEGLAPSSLEAVRTRGTEAGFPFVMNASNSKPPAPH